MEGWKPVQKKLDMAVIPWMPTSEHDTTELPVVTELGNRQYIIEKLNFSREGAWEVYIIIDKDRKEDAAVFDVNVFK